MCWETLFYNPYAEIVFNSSLLPVFVPEPWDTEDHMHHAGGAGPGAGDAEWRAAGEGEAVGRLEGNTGGGEEPGWEAHPGGPEDAGHRETEQVSSLPLNECKIPLQLHVYLGL